MAFPTTSVLDTLQGASLSANWTTGGVLGDAASMSEDANGAFEASGSASAYWNPATFGGDAEAFVTISTLPSASGNVAVWVRITNPPSATTTGYFLRVTPSTSVFDIRKKVGGAASASLTTFTQAVSAGDSFGFSASGTTLAAWYKPSGGSWASVGSIVDSSISGGGNVAFSIGNSSVTRLTSFGGGTTVVASTVVPARTLLGVGV